jgi:excinuclease ABC subunit A
MEKSNTSSSNIEIKGARVHNLQNIDLVIPRNKLIVITGVSGSGKSSLAFDTIYAEGQRRYVESLSAYARQFLGKINKPQVDYIKGLSPAIAIEQKVNTRNPRSTVGTSTEIYDYLKLLFARIGKTYSPISGELVKRHTITDVVESIVQQKAGTKVFILTSFNPKRDVEKQLELYLAQGFSRVIVKNEMQRIDELMSLMQSEPTFVQSLNANIADIKLLIDRVIVDEDTTEQQPRIADSIQTAFYEGSGECTVIFDYQNEKSTKSFSNKFELDGIEFQEPNVHFFTFNNPYGACKKCEGFGSVIGIDENLVIPDKSLSVFEGAVACWKGESMSNWKNEFIQLSRKIDFPIHRPYYDLSDEEKDLLWNGKGGFEGLNGFFAFLESQTYKIQYRVMLSRFRGKTVCPDCNGTRLRKDASYVKVGGKNLQELVLISIKDLSPWFKKLELTAAEQNISKRLLVEINSRLHFLNDVGLGYLTLNRLSNTLSGGESQRINLATSLGSSLVGSLYVLDEPSIGLHSKDTENLINVLQALKRVGNSVIVVEHDEDIMRSADEIIDIGPFAGSQGGMVVFQGNHEKLKSDEKSLTARYLNQIEKIEVPKKRRTWRNFIELNGIRENNLQNLTVKFPLGIITVVTGVSGSGKTTLVKRVFYPAIKKMFAGYHEATGSFDRISGDYNLLASVEFVDQNPIGKSSRSNPVTYIKAYDDIRNLFAEMQLSKQRGYKPAHFSFNVEGGRCEMCQGEGEVTVEMQFMADIHLECEACSGKRFKEEILEVLFNEKSIFDLLEMTVDDAIDFFKYNNTNNAVKKIIEKLSALQEVGLGYIHLGQSSSTLSGGEAQRIKLASFLLKGSTDGTTLFIFDEPTTGLHFHDIKKLLHAFNALVENGHSILIIEHNLEVIKCADWIIDMGPEGGDGGGSIMFEGTPENMIQSMIGHTSQYLAEKLK